MSLLAQTVAGEFDTADLCFLAAFICLTCSTLIAIFDAGKDTGTILLRLGLAVFAFGWWVT